MNENCLNKLYILLSKLRGKIPSETAVDILIFAMYLKYIEETDSSADEKYSLKYLSITYGKIVSCDEIINYVSDTETKYNVHNVISNYIGRILDKADSNAVCEVFGAVNEVECGYCFELSVGIVEKSVQSSGKEMAGFITDMSINRLMAKIVDADENMKIYDGYSGFGISANLVAKKTSEIYLQDLSERSTAMAAMISIMNGAVIGGIRCGDSLLNPISISEKFDRVLLDPPMMMRYNAEYLNSIPKGNCLDSGFEDADYIAVRHALARLSDDGIAAVILPAGLLFRQGKCLAARKKLVDNNYIDAIIEFPSGMYLSTAVVTAMMILRKNKSVRDIFMINIKSFVSRLNKTCYLSDGAISEIVELYRTRCVREGISGIASPEQIKAFEYNLCTASYLIKDHSLLIEYSDVKKNQKRYKQLCEELMSTDTELEKIRSRFIE